MRSKLWLTWSLCTVVIIGCQHNPKPTTGPEGNLGLQIQQSIAERGDPILVVAKDTAVLLKGLDPGVLQTAGISIRGNELTLRLADREPKVYQLSYVDTPQALLTYAHELQDSGDPEAIIYHHSACLAPVTCKVDCHPAGLSFFATETPLKGAKRCKRIEADKICVDTRKEACSRQLFTDPKCTKPAVPPFNREDWRCNG